MDLDKIQEMWQKDAVIDPDNLHDESLKIPQLHSKYYTCLLYTSPSPRDGLLSRMPSSA